MTSVRAIMVLAFAAAIGILFLTLGCALPQFNSYWPLWVLVFYALCPLPAVLARSRQDDVEATPAFGEGCVFITTVIVVSAYGLPIVLARVGTILWGAAACVLVGNTVMFGTILAYFTLLSGGVSDFAFG